MNKEQLLELASTLEFTDLSLEKASYYDPTDRVELDSNLGIKFRIDLDEDSDASSEIEIYESAKTLNYRGYVTDEDLESIKEDALDELEITPETLSLNYWRGSIGVGTVFNKGDTELQEEDIFKLMIAYFVNKGYGREELEEEFNEDSVALFFD